jgi:hypothetical protein
MAGEKGSTTRKPTINIPPQKPPKKQPEVAFTYDSDQQLEFPESPAPPIDNNKILGHLFRADWPAGKAGNEDCLLDEDDQPPVDELDPEAEEEQGYPTDWIGQQICPRRAQWQQVYQRIPL